MSSCCKDSFLLFLLLILCSLFLTRSELVYDEVAWSSSICSDQGYTDDLFDVCAVLEFCEGAGDVSGFHDNRERGMEDKMGYSMENPGSNFEYPNNPNLPFNPSSMNDPLHPFNGLSDKESSPRAARFGWKIEGSSTCTTPGPILRLERGTRYGLFVKGSTNPGTITNLHTHGLHIAGSGNADDVTRVVAGGDTLVYNYTIPDYHMGGTFWYHSHHHGDVGQQVGGGAFGMLIVEDGENFGSSDPNVIDFMNNEKVLVIDNIKESRFVANGQSMGEKYTFNKDEWYRLRVLLVSVDDYKSGAYVSFGDACTVHALAHDGILKFNVPAMEPKASYFLSTSSRIDVAIKCNEGADIKVDFSPVAVIEVLDSPAGSNSHSNASPFESGATQWTSTRPSYLADLTHMPVDDTLDIIMYETTINNKRFSHDTPICNSRGNDFSYDTVNEWTLKSTNGHPFHAHMFPMQVMSGCGDEHEVGEFYDTITFKNGNYENGDNCVVRLHFVDIAGHVMMHCHILLHEDQGSMGFINILDGPMQPAEPRVLKCANGAKEGCDPLVMLTHCSGPQYPMSHDMGSIAVGQDEIDLTEGSAPYSKNMDMNEGQTLSGLPVSEEIDQSATQGSSGTLDPQQNSFIISTTEAPLEESTIPTASETTSIHDGQIESTMPESEATGPLTSQESIGILDATSTQAQPQQGSPNNTIDESPTEESFSQSHIETAMNEDQTASEVTKPKPIDLSPPQYPVTALNETLGEAEPQQEVTKPLENVPIEEPNMLSPTEETGDQASSVSVSETIDQSSYSSDPVGVALGTTASQPITSVEEKPTEETVLPFDEINPESKVVDQVNSIYNEDANITSSTSQAATSNTANDSNALGISALILWACTICAFLIYSLVQRFRKRPKRKYANADTRDEEEEISLNISSSSNNDAGAAMAAIDLALQKVELAASHGATEMGEVLSNIHRAKELLDANAHKAKRRSLSVNSSYV